MNNLDNYRFNTHPMKPKKSDFVDALYAVGIIAGSFTVVGVLVGVAVMNPAAAAATIHALGAIVGVASNGGQAGAASNGGQAGGGWTPS